MSTNPTFVFGDPVTCPPKVNRTVESRNIYPGIVYPLASPATHPYALLLGAVIISIVNLPTLVCSACVPDKETAVIVGKTAAYLEFANSTNAGKQPGDTAFTSDTHERCPQKLALMIISSQYRSKLEALQPEYKEMGEHLADMIQELRDAPPEDDVCFLNAEFYMHGAKLSGNSNMKEGGSHLPVWNSFRELQHHRYKLSTEIGIWHEVYKISNAEAIYPNMPCMGLGDVWDAVPTADGQVVYRNSLVTGSRTYSSSHG
ncbi:hypothetical protein K439DRAFT_1619876 [Ramaria rubella]|nr:hypothetical protein K439DRAFT_1619876 [Ramaria rubella]